MGGQRLVSPAQRSGATRTVHGGGTQRRVWCGDIARVPDKESAKVPFVPAYLGLGWAGLG